MILLVPSDTVFSDSLDCMARSNVAMRSLWQVGANRD